MRVHGAKGGATPLRPAIAKGKPLTVIPFGDSITNFGSTGDNQFGSSFSNAGPLLTKRPMRVIRNAGIVGDTTQMMLARIDADVIAHKPNVCILMGGTNDAATAMTNAQIAGTMGNLETMVKRLMGAGIVPVLVTPPPRNDQTTTLRTLQFFYYMLAQHYGIPLFDLYRVTVEPTNSTIKPAFNLGDGLHLNGTGHGAAAAELAKMLDDIGTAYCRPYLAAAAETAGNQLANSVFNGNCANTSAVNVPTGWALPAIGTVELVPATLPYTGNALRHTRPDGTDGNGPTNFGPNLSGGGFQAGDEMEFNFALEVTGLDGATASGFQFYLLSQNGNPGSLQPFYMWKSNGFYEMNYRFTLPPGTTNLNIANFIRDAGVYTYRNVTIVNRTRHERIWKPGA